MYDDEALAGWFEQRPQVEQQWKEILENIWCAFGSSTPVSTRVDEDSQKLFICIHVSGSAEEALAHLQNLMPWWRTTRNKLNHEVILHDEEKLYCEFELTLEAR